jgi:hypothetical protein
MDDIEDLPDKCTLDLTTNYSIKLNPGYRKKIAIINGYKDGLTAEIREAIESVIDRRWHRLQIQLGKEDQAG